MCMSLPAYVYLCHEYLLPLEVQGGIKSPESRITEVVRCHMCSGN